MLYYVLAIIWASWLMSIDLPVVGDVGRIGWTYEVNDRAEGLNMRKKKQCHG